MALIQQRAICGLWRPNQLKLGLPLKSNSSSVQCGGRRNLSIRSELKTESSNVVVLESKENGAMPTFSGTSSSSGEFIGYGMLDERNFYRERFVVRFSEVGDRGSMSLEMLSSLLQEAACNHVLKIGYGAFAGTNERLVTVTTRMHIEVDRYPKWRDFLEVDTWYCTEGRNAVRRDWTVKDVNTGEIIAVATSTWVIMNMDTKVIQRITEQIRSEFAPWAREPPKWALSEDRIKASSGRIPKINGDAEFHTTGLSPSERDLDMNQHVNNVKYISWTMESLPLEFRDSHEIRKITLEYRREVQKGDTLESRAKAEVPSENGAGSTEEERFVHVIRNQDGQEINKGRTVWTRRR